MLNKIADIILKHPKLILCVISIFTLYFGYTAFLSDNKLQVDFSLEQMFPNNDVDRDYYESFITEFGKDENTIFLVYSCDSIFSKNKIEENAIITEEFEFIEGVDEVLSVSTLPNGKLQNFDLSKQQWDIEVSEIQKHLLYSKLFSTNNNNSSIIIKLNNDVITQNDRKFIIEKIETILESTSWEWHLAGIPVMRTKYIQLVIQERIIFLPLAFLVVIFVLTFTFRQIKGVLIPLIAITTTLIWVAGLMALFNVTINVISYLTFNLLMIIGVADAIHLLIKYHEGLKKGLQQISALKEVINEIGGALFLTSFTTAVGFLSLIFTNIRITKEFGVTLGFGVVLLFILTIVIMPAILSLINVPNKSHIQRLIVGGRLQTAEKLNKWNELHPKSILIITAGLIIFSIVGLSRMNYNASIFDDLKPGNKIFDDIQYIENEFGGTLPLEIVVKFDESNKEITIAKLKNIEALGKYLFTIPEVSSVFSIIDQLKLQNEILYDSYSMPSPQDVISLLASYDSKMISSNNNFRISAKIKNINTQRSDEIKSEILSVSQKIFPKSVEVGITGTTLLALKTNKHLVTNLTTSFIIAFFVIFISMTFLFRSIWLSFLSILPIIVPLLVAGGLMGYLGIKLRPSTAMTFSIALGITVDDTIHFLSRFRREFIKTRNHAIATERTLLTTGKAILNTTIVLGMGFFVLIFSEFAPNEEFGLLATIIIIVALGASVILLPVLINIIKPKFLFKNNLRKLNSD